MRRTRSSLLIVAGAVVAAFTPALLRAQLTGLDDLVGARAGQAEGEFGRRGWRNVGGQQSDDRSYTFWWNAAQRQCVTVVTREGRYDSITPSPAPDCRQSAGGRPEPDYSSRPVQPRPDYQQPSYQPNYGRPTTLPGRPVVGGQTVELGLVCYGDGSRDGLTSRPAWTWNDGRQRYDYGNQVEGTTETFDATLQVQTWPGGGRIRLPKSLIPPINSRGNYGWWDLYDVAVGRDSIAASYRLNGLNKPRLTIDRRSGRITIQGAADYGFRGTCDLIGNDDRRF